VIDQELPAALAGERLDRVVAFLGDVSRARAASLVAEGAVQVNGSVVRQRSLRVEAGDRVAFATPELAPVVVDPATDVAVAVVHEDEALVVVDKPAGLVVHPGAGHEQGTLVNGLLARFPEMAGVGEPTRPGIVHRLDAGTSGLLVVARTPGSYVDLVRQLQARTVERVYDALAWGTFDDDAALIDAPIGRSPRDPTRMAVRADGREARTRYLVASRWSRPAVSRLTCHLETGRTHQIRVHLTAIGHPVVGDARYGGSRDGLQLDRPWLHACRLRFRHPTTGEEVTFVSPLPGDLQAVLDHLGPPEPSIP
jgi:23S rRNA pseudouridine1911/1915/1917 synthase